MVENTTNKLKDQVSIRQKCHTIYTVYTVYGRSANHFPGKGTVTAQCWPYQNAGGKQWVVTIVNSDLIRPPWDAPLSPTPIKIVQVFSCSVSAPDTWPNPNSAKASLFFVRWLALFCLPQTVLKHKYEEMHTFSVFCIGSQLDLIKIIVSKYKYK